MKKHRKLTDMEIQEASFVDAPANKRRFLLIKRDHDEKMRLSIATDGTDDGTDIRVNGEALPDLVNFHFSYRRDGSGSPVSCSYSISNNDHAHTDHVETYYLSKPETEVNKMESMDLLKSIAGIDIPGNAIQDEEFKKAMETLAEYHDLMPADLQNAMKNLTKQAVATVMEAAEHETSSAEPITPEEEKISREISLLLKAISGLATAATGHDDSRDPDPTIAEIKQTLQSMSTRVEAVEKTTAGNKSSDDHDGDDPRTVQKSNTKWPSLSPWLGQ